MHLPSGPELIIVLLIVVVLFGANKVPQLMKGVGEGMREFKKATREEDETPAPIASPTSITNHNEPRV